MKRTGTNMKRNGNHEGSWRQLKSGNLQFERWYTAKTGEKTRLRVSGKNKSICDRLMKEKEAEFELTSRVNYGTKEFLENGLRDWLFNVKKFDPECGHSYFDRLESLYRIHILDSYLGKMKERQIVKEDIITFMNELKKHTSEGDTLKEPLSYSSKKKIFELLKMYFDDKYIRSPELNPMLGLKGPKKEQTVKIVNNTKIVDEENTQKVPLDSVWDDEQMDAIHEYCMRPYAPGKKGSVKRGPLISFLMWSFIRSGELRALTWDKVHLDGSHSYVSIEHSYKKGTLLDKPEWYIGDPKTDKGKRKVYLCPQAVEAITEYKRRFPPKNENDYVCAKENGGTILAKNFNDALDCILNGLGYDKMAEKNKTVHGLRHTGISYAIRAGRDLLYVSKMAGHASIDTTQRVYLEIIDKYCKKENEKFWNT